MCPPSGVIGFPAASSSGEVIYESNDELVYRFVPIIDFAGRRSAASTAASISRGCLGIPAAHCLVEAAEAAAGAPAVAPARDACAATRFAKPGACARIGESSGPAAGSDSVLYRQDPEGWGKVRLESLQQYNLSTV